MTLTLDPVVSLLAAVFVLLIGTVVNARVAVLSRYNIPDPVTGGLLFAAVAAVAWGTTDLRIVMDQQVKPVLLLMFFAGVGMCADLRMLRRGGKALVLFLLVLLPFILVQNVVGVAAAYALDLHPIFGLVAGSITLVGGHGTGAAYAQRFAEVNNLQAVMELSMTVATIGLIVGGVIAGPVAQFLISRHGLRSQAVEPLAADSAEAPVGIGTVGTIGSLAGILAAVVAGRWLAAEFSGGTITVPAFLWCMILGVAIRNLVPFTGVRLDDRASDLISGVCLSLFLVMTMMTLDLVEVALTAGPFVVIIAAQIVAISLYAVLVCFRVMGRDYEAAVASAAFIGFNMGSTATAMANMQAITTRYGPAPQSYLIVPLSGAFFIDIMNAFLLTGALALPFIGG
jgi:ESS family glutamate:Na+ symporter